MQPQQLALPNRATIRLTRINAAQGLESAITPLFLGIPQTSNLSALIAHQLLYQRGDSNRRLFRNLQGNHHQSMGKSRESHWRRGALGKRGGEGAEQERRVCYSIDFGTGLRAIASHV